MGANGAMGHSAAAGEPRQEGCEPKADLHAMHLEAVSWEGHPVGQKTAQRNRQFLANFAIYLVQQFRLEEAQLKMAKSPCLASHRLENRRLALRLRDLMAAVDQGLEVTSDISAFLGAWRFRQEMPVWRVAAVGKGH